MVGVAWLGSQPIDDDRTGDNANCQTLEAKVLLKDKEPCEPEGWLMVGIKELECGGTHYDYMAWRQSLTDVRIIILNFIHVERKGNTVIQRLTCTVPWIGTKIRESSK